MARIHNVNLYPTATPMRKGQMLKITNGTPSTSAGVQSAPAFSAAQRQAEAREIQRVQRGAPGHLQGQGVAAPTWGAKAGAAQGTPIMAPPPANAVERLRATIASRIPKVNRPG